MAAYSMVYYLKTFVFPFALNAMHPYPDLAGKSFPQAYYIAPWILLALSAGLAIIIVKLKKYRKDIVFGLFFFLFSISIVLHIIPIYGRVVVADRYTYLAYTGLFYLVALMLFGIYQRWKHKNIRIAVIAVLAVIVLMFSFQTFSRNRVWNNDLAFWTDVTEKSPANHYAIYSLGLAYIDRGQPEQALKMYNKAIGMYQGFTEYYVNRSGCLIKLQRYEDAIGDLNRVISEQPDNAIAYNNRGIAWFRLLEYEKALADYDSALHYLPGYAEATNNREKVLKHLQHIAAANSGDFAFNEERAAFFNDLGVAKVKKGEYKEAFRFFEYAQQYNPGNTDVCINLGNVYVNLMMLPEAAQQFGRVISMKPASAEAYLFRGNTLHQMMNVDAACADWQKALELGMKQAGAMIEKYCR
jgi:tetratricopeptide (TPR) repeat protein